jgi:hypothetical protein
MATTTNFGWTTPNDTDLVKDGAAAIRTALGGPDTSFVGLKGGTTGQVLSKTSATDLAFTWVAQDDSNAIQNAIVDAKGDLIGATAADTPARLAVGTNGQLLTADSTAATGLAWATPAAGGGMTLISTYVANNTAATFTVSSISSSYKQLILTGTGIQSAGTGATISYRINSDSGANYVGRALGFEAGGAQQSDPSGDVYGYVYAAMGRSTDTVNRFGSFWLNVYNIQESDSYKGLDFNSSCRNNNDFQFYSGTGFWKNSSTAVTSITVSAASNFNAGTFKLYGVA